MKQLLPYQCSLNCKDVREAIRRLKQLRDEFAAAIDVERLSLPKELPDSLLVDSLRYSWHSTDKLIARLEAALGDIHLVGPKEPA